jgi:hypothetical protein
MEKEKKEGENQEKILPSDYYIENNRVVFTEYYHKNRGYCCGSINGCRHCPYEPKGVKGNTILKS